MPALVLTFFRLTKSRAMYFRPETIVESFLRLMVLLFKVLLNHTLKRQFCVLHCRPSEMCQKVMSLDLRTALKKKKPVHQRRNEYSNSPSAACLNLLKQSLTSLF